MSTLSPVAAATPASAPPRKAEPQPDLKIDAFEPTTYFPRPGDRVYFDVRVINRGEADATGFNVELSGSGIPRGTKVRVEGLKPGETAEFEMGPMNVLWRDFNFAEVRADSDREVTESNERNNRKSVTLIGPEPPEPPRPPIPVPPRP